MRILKIWDADYPWDIRVEKICRSLAQSKHDVHIIARNLKKDAVVEETDFCCIHRLPFFNNNKVNYYISFPAFFNPLWVYSITKLIKKFRIELILVRDLPLALSGIYVGKRYKIPVILDMAENYPFLIDDIWKFEPFQLQNCIIRNRVLTRLVEKFTFRYIDHVITVVDESRSRVLRCSPLKDENVSIVSNTPDLVNLKSYINFPCEDLELFRQKFVAVYVGGVRLGRGLDQVFKAIPMVVEKIKNFMFVIIGTGKNIEILKNLSVNLGIQDYVYFKGWVDPDRVPSIVQCADVGVIPHYVTSHINHTVPNKLFDYMSLGLPVIASEAMPIKRILDQEECGITFKDSAELANAVVQLKSKKLRDFMGEKGREAVARRYNWQHDAFRLNEVIKRFS